MLFKTIEPTLANEYVSDLGYQFKDISGSDNFQGYVVDVEGREVLKVRKSIYHYLMCDENSKENFNQSLCSKDDAIIGCLDSVN